MTAKQEGRKVVNNWEGSMAQLLERLRQKRSPFIDANILIEFVEKGKGTADFRRYCEWVAEDIQAKGEESLYHLGLPNRIVDLLRRDGIGTITQLRGRVEPEYRYLPNGDKTNDLITDALLRFESRLKELEKRRNLG